MCSPSAPPAPDYAGAAAQQAASSKEIATQQTWANRPNQYTPWGSTTWGATAGKDPATGQDITQWTQQEQLNPQLQNALNEQLAIQSGRSELAGGFMNRVAEEHAKPFDWTNLPSASGVPQGQMTGTYGAQGYIPTTTGSTNEAAFAGERQRIEQGLFDRMRPEQQFQEDRTRTMLANQGLTPGSEAYNRELERLGQQQAGERYNAMQMGGQEQARMQQMLLGQQQQAFGQMGAQADLFNRAGQQMYGQELGANQQNFSQMQQMADYQNRLRQQAISEQAMARGMSLNEMNAMLTGQQVSTPQMPSFMGASSAQPLQALQAAGMQGQYGLGAAGLEGQSQSGLWGGLGSLAGGAMMMY